jgi:protein SCO1/2
MKSARPKRYILATAALWLAGGLFGGAAFAQGHNYVIPESPAGTQNNSLGGRQIVASRDVGLDQKLGEKIPLDIPFVDETGKTVHLRDYFHKNQAVVFNLIFYRCPGVCVLNLKGMVAAFRKMRVKPGQDFQVVTVSINPKEGPAQAADRKEATMQALEQPGAEKGWHFLTGKHEDIQRLAQALGYRYAYDLEKEQFAHPAGLTLVMPDGTISRYFYGSNYKPRDLQLGLVETSENKIGTLVDAVLLKCLHYDALTGKYSYAVVNLLKFAAGLTILALAVFWWIMVRWERNRKRLLDAEFPPQGGQPTVV